MASSALRIPAPPGAPGIEPGDPVQNLIATSLLTQRTPPTAGRTYPQQAELSEAVTAIEHIADLKGSSQLKVTLQDPSWSILDSGIFDTDENSKLDPIDMTFPANSEYRWMLMQVGPSSDHTITLTFLNYYAWRLMRTIKRVKSKRGSVTRAQFLQSLASEIPGLNFYSNQLGTDQPVATNKALKKANSKKGKAKGLINQTVTLTQFDGSSATLTTAQKENAAAVMQTIDTFKSPPQAAVVACLCACIVEGPMFSNPDGGTGSSKGILQYTDQHSIDPTDISAVVHDFMTDGAASAALGIGAIGLAKANPSWSPGRIAQACQGSAYADRYEQVTTSANTILSDFGGTGASGSVEEIQAYYFQVGGSSNPHETYWHAMQRLAGQVNWALLLDGNNLYYDSQMTLIQQQVSAEVGRDDAFVGDWNYTWDVRHIATQVSLDVVMLPFSFFAGQAFQLDNFGTATSGSTATPKRPGVWLISEVDQDLQSLTATLTMVQPSKPKREPAPDIKEQSASSTYLSDNTPKTIGAAIGAAQALSNMDVPYRKAHYPNSNASPKPPYLDCSSSTSWVLYQSGWLAGKTALDSGEFASWGLPGKGENMTIWVDAAVHVFIEFHPAGGKHMQGNTSYASANGESYGDGFQYFPWGQNGESDAASGSYQPRHAKGM
jgi:hypothetical protein